MAKHPDFAEIQQRLRRINPAWYDPRLAIDDEYGPGMAFGLDAALDMLEEAHNLPAWAPPAAASGAGKLPRKFAFLMENPVAPLMVRLAIDTLGTLETRGGGNNPTIIGWADEVATVMPSAYARWAADWYNSDSIPWCGLWLAVIASRASQGREERFPPNKYLAALEWAKFGKHVDPAKAEVGDVMVLGRTGGGHVCLNVGMEIGGKRFFGLGGNQSDAVNIMPFDMSRVRAVRRPNYMVKPKGSRQVMVGPGGLSSTNEA